MNSNSGSHVQADFQPNDYYEGDSFIRMRSLVYASIIFGLITFFISKFLPVQYIRIGDVLVICYCILIVILAFATNLTYIQQLSPTSIKQTESFNVINQFSLIEALFFGLSFFLLTRLIGYQNVFDIKDVSWITIFVLTIAFLSLYLQEKIWQAHHRNIVSDLLGLIRTQSNDEAIQLVADIYDFALVNGKYVPKPPNENAQFHRALRLRFVYLLVSIIIVSVILQL